MRCERIDLTVIHNNDAVCILNTGDTLCDDDLRRTGNLRGKCLTDLRIGTELAEGSIPLLGDDGEYHDEVLLDGNVLLFSVYDPERLTEKEMDRIYQERSLARAAGLRPVVVYAGEGGIYSSDKKTLMSLNRSNGGASLLVDGQIVRKWTNASMPGASELSQLSEQDPSQLVADTELRGRRLLGIISVVGVVLLLI